MGQHAHSVSVTGDIVWWLPSPGGYHSCGEGAELPHPEDRSSQCQGGEWKWGENIGEGANWNVVLRLTEILYPLECETAMRL